MVDFSETIVAVNLSPYLHHYPIAATWRKRSKIAAPIAAPAFAVLALFGTGPTQAAEIKLLVSNAMKTTLEELAPQFEMASEHKLAITFGAASELKTDIEKGAVFDVAILTPAVIDALVKDGKLSAAGGDADRARRLRDGGAPRRPQARHRHHRGVQAHAPGRELDRLRGGGRRLALFQKPARAVRHRRPGQIRS